MRRPAFESALLVAVFAFEFFLFDQFGARRFSWNYPPWHDQIQYLEEAYTGYELARNDGFLSGLWHTLANPTPQGTLHDTAALIAFELAGPSRSAALALNIAALIAWQAALYFTLRRTGSSQAFAFAAALLPVALRGPWDYTPGSAYDFRLDHLAMCALGVASCAALLTDRFASRRWSAIFGAIVAMVLATRFLTGTYFVVIFAGLLGWVLWRDSHRSERLTNLALAAFVASAIAGPIFWINREALWSYYYVGHFVGPESAIRDPHLGLGGSATFVFREFLLRHVGPVFGGVALFGTVAFRWARDPKITPKNTRAERWLIGALWLLSPAIVLTLHRQKSEVVVGALAPGAVSLVVAAWGRASRAVSTTRRCTLAAAAAGGAALAFFGARQFAPGHASSTVAELRQLNAVADLVFERARTARLSHPRVAVDYITELMDARGLRVLGYERHRVWIPFATTLPMGLEEPAENEVMERLRGSDFVFLGADDLAAGPYPYDQKLAALRPKLRVWCEAHLRVVTRFTLLGRRVVLYQRPEIPFR